MTEKKAQATETRGRPELSESERRSVKIEVRLTQAEKIELAQRASSAGIPMSEYARKILLADSA